MIPGEGVRVECAFSTAPDDPAPAYEDITSSVLMSPGISITRGRSSEAGAVSTGICSMTLINDDGRFTAENPASPYFPNVTIGRRLRVSRRNPATLGLFNLATNGDFSPAAGTAGWSTFGFGSSPTLAISTARSAWAHGQSMLVTWGNEATGASALTNVPTVIGRQYVAQALVYVPAGSPSVKLQRGLAVSPVTTETGVLQVLTVPFTATSSSSQIGVTAAVTTAGQQVWILAFACDEGSRTASVSSGQTNVVTNGSMRTNATGWSFGTNGGTVTVGRQTSGGPTVNGQTLPFYEGVWTVAPVSGTSVGPIFGSPTVSVLPLDPSTTYYASAWVRITQASPVVNLVTFHDAGGATLSSAQSVAVTAAAGVWKNITWSFTTPANTVRGYFRNYATTGAPTPAIGDKVAATGLTLSTQPIAESFDGQSHPGLSAWVGSAGASASQMFAGPAFVTTAPPIKNRFTGYVDQWPVEWPSGPSLARVAITASDRLKRLAGRQSLGSVIHEELTLDGPTAYFPLSEAEGATSVGDVSGANRILSTVLDQSGIGGTIDFGQGVAPSTDSSSTPKFSPVDVNNGKAIRVDTASVPLNSAGAGFGSNVTIECCVSTTAVSRRLIHADDTWGIAIAVDLTAAGKPLLMVSNPWAPGQPVLTVTSSGAAINDDAQHHVAVTVTPTTGNLYVDGVLVGTVSTATAYPGGLLQGIRRVLLGGYAGNLYAGTLSHVAVFEQALDARIAAHAAACLTGFAGERSDQRVGRLLSYASVPSTERALDVGLSTNIDHVDTAGSSALAIAQRVAETEAGVFLVNRDGAVAFHGRGRRYDAPVAAALTVGDVRPAAILYNDQDLANDVTARRSRTGYSARAFDASSIDAYGVANGGGDLDLVSGSDAEVDAAAAWRVATRSRPASRLPGVVVDLLALSAALVDDVLDLEVSDRVTLSGLAAQAPASALDLFVEGYAETISDTAWELAYNTSAVSVAGRVWKVEDPVFGSIDSTNRIAY